jgi:hypothetical protein
MLGFFVVALDAQILNVALPDIQASLGGGLSGLQWVVTGYTLTFASLQLDPDMPAPPAGGCTTAAVDHDDSLTSSLIRLRSASFRRVRRHAELGRTHWCVPCWADDGRSAKRVEGINPLAGSNPATSALTRPNAAAVDPWLARRAGPWSHF